MYRVEKTGFRWAGRAAVAAAAAAPVARVCRNNNDGEKKNATSVAGARGERIPNRPADRLHPVQYTERSPPCRKKK